MTDKEFIDTVEGCQSMAYASKLVGMSYRTIREKAKKLGCFKPNQRGKGVNKPRKEGLGKIPLSEILEGKQPQYNVFRLKTRLIREGILEDKCSVCNWNERVEGSEFSSCELDHINGNSLDHRLENLRILCPNCHSLTKTFRFRRGKANRIEHQGTKVLE